MLFIALFIILLVAGSFLQNLSPFPFLRSKFIYGTIGVIAGLLSVWLFQKKENLPIIAAIGLKWERKTPLRFIYGLLIGTAIFMFIMFVLLSCTHLSIRYSPKTFSIQSLSLYAALVPLALMEEIGFRTYPQIKLNSACGIWVSQFIVAICFGVYHILNGWNIQIAFYGPFVWAFVFGLAALWSGGIAMPTGIHLALNILQNLAGLKGSKAALWTISYPQGGAKTFMENPDHIGLVLQGIVLISALILTGWYKNRNIKA